MECVFASLKKTNPEYKKVLDKIQSGKVRKRHGHFENMDDTMEVLNNPTEVFRSGGKRDRLIFHDGENVVVVGTKGSEKGWIVTDYGPKGSAGRVSVGDPATTPRGAVVTREDIVSGTIPSKGHPIPKAESIWSKG